MLLCLAAAVPALQAQQRESALSDAEIEQLRDAAYFPASRVMVFVKIVDSRVDRLRALYAKARQPGREEDTHDLLEQVTSICDELQDNLDDYSTRHRDVRKQLPKLQDAIERWTSTIRGLPEDEAYDVSRRLTLESLGDLREEAAKMLEDQKTWFAAHPPPKNGSTQSDR
ncbi:MAG: hypothetical protein KGK08_02605 [Acidobacteriota bacterium]|nr:hypothetical protein [Acidobacteriota bacterium]